MVCVCVHARAPVLGEGSQLCIGGTRRAAAGPAVELPKDLLRSIESTSPGSAFRPGAAGLEGMMSTHAVLHVMDENSAALGTRRQK